MTILSATTTAQNAVASALKLCDICVWYGGSCSGFMHSNDSRYPRHFFWLEKAFTTTFIRPSELLLTPFPIHFESREFRLVSSQSNPGKFRTFHEVHSVGPAAAPQRSPQHAQRLQRPTRGAARAVGRGDAAPCGAKDGAQALDHQPGRSNGGLASSEVW